MTGRERTNRSLARNTGALCADVIAPGAAMQAPSRYNLEDVIKQVKNMRTDLRGE